MTAVAQEIDGSLQPGERIGDHWIVRSALGSGGHATVYLAQHDLLGHHAAIKVLHLDRCGGAVEEMIGRFRREARIAAIVRHENVVRVFDSGDLADGSPFFVMDVIDGEDLQQRIDREGPLPVAAAVDVGVQVLAGLHALAEHGVIHRDVKPGNVMLEPMEAGGYVAKLVDFGIASVLEIEIDAKMTLEGTVLGTPEYMSPEQIRGLDLDPRADVYSLGVVLFEALTGELPFAGKGPCATLAMALTQDPPTVRSRRPEVPPELEDVVMRALAKDRERRWTTPLAMAAALAETREQLGLATGADAWADGAAIALTRIAGRAPEHPRSGPDGARSEEKGPRQHESRPRAKRPAARAGRSGAARAGLDPEIAAHHEDPREDGALLDDPLEDGEDVPVAQLDPKHRSQGRAVARIVIAMLGLDLATAFGLELRSPEEVEPVAGEEARIGEVQREPVPDAGPTRAR